MDPTSPASSMSLQNTLPEMYPVENVHLQALVACQGAIIQAYQEHLTTLQASNEQLQ